MIKNRSKKILSHKNFLHYIANLVSSRRAHLSSWANTLIWNPSQLPWEPNNYVTWILGAGIALAPMHPPPHCSAAPPPDLTQADHTLPSQQPITPPPKLPISLLFPFLLLTMSTYFTHFDPHQRTPFVQTVQQAATKPPSHLWHKHTLPGTAHHALCHIRFKFNQWITILIYLAFGALLLLYISIGLPLQVPSCCNLHQKLPPLGFISPFTLSWVILPLMDTWKYGRSSLLLVCQDHASPLLLLHGNSIVILSCFPTSMSRLDSSFPFLSISDALIVQKSHPIYIPISFTHHSVYCQYPYLFPPSKPPQFTPAANPGITPSSNATLLWQNGLYPTLHCHPKFRLILLTSLLLQHPAPIPVPPIDVPTLPSTSHITMSKMSYLITTLTYLCVINCPTNLSSSTSPITGKTNMTSLSLPAATQLNHLCSLSTSTTSITLPLFTQLCLHSINLTMCHTLSPPETSSQLLHLGCTSSIPPCCDWYHYHCAQDILDSSLFFQGHHILLPNPPLIMSITSRTPVSSCLFLSSHPHHIGAQLSQIIHSTLLSFHLCSSHSPSVLHWM